MVGTLIDGRDGGLSKEEGGSPIGRGIIIIEENVALIKDEEWCLLN